MRDRVHRMGLLLVVVLLLPACTRLGFGGNPGADLRPGDVAPDDAALADAAPGDRTAHDGAGAEGGPGDAGAADACADASLEAGPPVGTWQAVSVGTSANLNAVVALSPTKVYAAGFNGTVLAYDGKSWTALAPPTSVDLTGIWAVTGASGTRVYVVGGADLWVLDQQQWTHFPSGLSTTWNGVWGSSVTDVLLVGDKATVNHFDGTSLTTPGFAKCGAGSLRAVTGSVGLSTAWIAGTAGSYCVVDLTAQQLTPKPLGLSQASFNAVWAHGTQTWLVGESGLVVTVASGSPTVQGGVASGSLRGVWGSSPSNVWAVGTTGTVLHYDGKSWTSVPSGTLQHLLAISGTAADNVWIVGNGGTVLRSIPPAP